MIPEAPVGGIRKGGVRSRWGGEIDSPAKVGCLEKPRPQQAGRTQPGPAPGAGALPAGGPLIFQQIAYSTSPRLGWPLAARVGRWENTRELSAQDQGLELARQGRRHLREGAGGGSPGVGMTGCWPRTPLKAAGWPQGWDSQALLLAFAGSGETWGGGRMTRTVPAWGRGAALCVYMD